MTSERSSGPRSEVFTTALWDGNYALADWDLHFARLSKHAKALRIHLPENMAQQLEELFEKEMDLTKTPQSNRPSMLMRIGCSDGEVRVQARKIDLRNEEIDAITVEAPRWASKVNGTKHGDWEAYRIARGEAEKKGSDMAFLVHDYAIVDADRATPIVLDEDGVAWMAASSEGGVDSITFDILSKELHNAGIPIQRGRLNERLVARASEMITLGSGSGACRIASLDGEQIGEGTKLSAMCQTLLEQHYLKEETWFDVRVPV